MHKPLCIDVFCGLGGWTEGFLAEGWDCVGFDIERHDYGSGGYPAQLVLQDALTIHGKQFRQADCLVMSPPCQFFSYCAMPWSRAKKLEAEVWSHPERKRQATALFDVCFRIQREAIEAAGHFIPLVVENVRGAQKWVGRSRWNYGSFHLWGDVPALMPMTKTASMEGTKTVGRSLGRNAVKKFGPHNMGSGQKINAELGIVTNGQARKAASAAIAKIPGPLARHIAAYWKPVPF